MGRDRPERAGRGALGSHVSLDGSATTSGATEPPGGAPSQRPVGSIPDLLCSPNRMDFMLLRPLEVINSRLSNDMRGPVAMGSRRTVSFPARVVHENGAPARRRTPARAPLLRSKIFPRWCAPHASRLMPIAIYFRWPDIH
jgi:hypothetical protein